MKFLWNDSTWKQRQRELRRNPTETEKAGLDTPAKQVTPPYLPFGKGEGER
ncbi:MAG: hypothetical protein QME90_13190 [Thermodesulfobacteriota bacterium]|nr:hypothetical protein [Thermodesulfobacteriota bacterium]